MRLVKNFPAQAIAAEKIMDGLPDYSALEMRVLSLYDIGSEAMRLRQRKDAEFWRIMYGGYSPRK